MGPYGSSLEIDGSVWVELGNCLRFPLPAEAVWWLGGLEGKVGEVKVKIVYHHWVIFVSTKSPFHSERRN